MRLKIGRVPENAEFSPGETGWIPIKEPSPWIAQLLAFPIGVAVAWVMVFLWAQTGAKPRLENPIFWLIVLIIGVFILHEIIHAIFHPRAGRSHKTIIGVWLSRGLFYAFYDDLCSRERFIVIILAPFVIISLVPLAGAFIVGGAPVQLAFVSVFNCLVSCMDILGAWLIMTRVPRNARVRNKGWRTYYKIVDARDGE